LIAKLQLSTTKGFARTAQSSVTEYLRQAILAGDLPAGTRLVQAELAEALNVSVTPIREALRELSTEGLIDLDAFRGAVVHTPALEELENIYEVRAALMPLNIHKSIEAISVRELDEAEKILDLMEQETSQTRWIELNRQFHELLHSTNKNGQLKDILQRLADIASIYINLSLLKQPLQQGVSNDEHRAILKSYRDRDVDRAIALSLDHINSTLEAARQAF